jgi:hypothetical protein
VSPTNSTYYLLESLFISTLERGPTGTIGTGTVTVQRRRRLKRLRKYCEREKSFYTTAHTEILRFRAAPFPKKTMMRLQVLFAVLLVCLLKAGLVLSQEEASSGACAQESAILNANSNVSAAVDNLKTETNGVLQSFADFCSVLSLSCSADIGSLDSAKELNATCTAEGGQIIERDVGLECTGTLLLGIPIPGGFTVETTNVPVCVGMSCDSDGANATLPPAVESLFRTVLEGAETQISMALGDGVNCTSVNDSSGASVFSWSLGVTTTLAVLGAMVAML